MRLYTLFDFAPDVALASLEPHHRITEIKRWWSVQGALAADSKALKVDWVRSYRDSHGALTLPRQGRKPEVVDPRGALPSVHRSVLVRDEGSKAFEKKTASRELQTLGHSGLKRLIYVDRYALAWKSDATRHTRIAAWERLRSCLPSVRHVRLYCSVHAKRSHRLPCCGCDAYKRLGEAWLDVDAHLAVIPRPHCLTSFHDRFLALCDEYWEPQHVVSLGKGIELLAPPPATAKSETEARPARHVITLVPVAAFEAALQFFSRPSADGRQPCPSCGTPWADEVTAPPCKGSL